MKHNLKAVRFFAIAAMLLLGACSNPRESKAPTGSGTPVISADVINYEFGQVDEGTKVEHVFKIQNKGDGVLEIKKATGS